MAYVERRVTTAYYGTLPGSSSLLIPVPTTPGHRPQRLHTLAANAFQPMAAAVENDLGITLRCASGWRPHRWTSRAQYEAFVIQRYGSVAKGRLYLAFDSPHETGLACDFGCGGLEPRSATIETQKQTPLFHWLIANADKFGWTPYKVEPWHFEHWLSLDSYRSGVAAPQVEAVTTCSDSNDVCVEAPLDET
jgi:LAS superfamily LD-carboxypeptidase LdcB